MFKLLEYSKSFKTKVAAAAAAAAAVVHYSISECELKEKGKKTVESLVLQFTVKMTKITLSFYCFLVEKRVKQV